MAWHYGFQAMRSTVSRKKGNNIFLAILYIINIQNFPLLTLELRFKLWKCWQDIGLWSRISKLFVEMNCFIAELSDPHWLYHFPFLNTYNTVHTHFCSEQLARTLHCLNQKPAKICNQLLSEFDSRLVEIQAHHFDLEKFKMPLIYNVNKATVTMQVELILVKCDGSLHTKFNTFPSIDF